MPSLLAHVGAAGLKHRQYFVQTSEKRSSMLKSRIANWRSVKAADSHVAFCERVLFANSIFTNSIFANSMFRDVQDIAALNTFFRVSLPPVC